MKESLPRTSLLRARRHLQGLSLCLVAAVLAGCASAKLTAVPEGGFSDSLGPMPCMKDRSLIPNLEDPHVKAMFDITVETAATCKGLIKEHRPEEGMQLVKEAIAKVEPELGPEHCYTGALYDLLPEFTRTMAPFEEHKRVLERCVSTRVKYLGDGCVDTARSVHTLAVALIEHGDADEALAVTRQHWQSAQKQPPSLCSKVYYLYTEALALRALNRDSEALPLISEAVKLKNEVPSLKNLYPPLTTIIPLAGQCALAAGDYRQASDVLDIYVHNLFGRFRNTDDECCLMLLACARYFKKQNDSAALQRCLQDASAIAEKGMVAPGTQMRVRAAVARWGSAPAGSSG